VGWKSGSNAEWDKERALFPAQAFAFLQDTQGKLWAEMGYAHGLASLALESDGEVFWILTQGCAPGAALTLGLPTGHPAGVCGKERESVTNDGRPVIGDC
jgi:hypothetical protein